MKNHTLVVPKFLHKIEGTFLKNSNNNYSNTAYVNCVPTTAHLCTVALNIFIYTIITNTARWVE